MKKGILTTVVGAVILAVFAGNVLAYDYIVESRSGGKNYDKYSDYYCGNSTVKSVAAGCTSGIGSRYATNLTCWATYKFTPLESGTWEVFATWANSTNGDTVVPHAVTHDGGTTTVNMNQNQAAALGNKWNSLGSYSFTRGVEYNVTQTNPTADGGGSPPRLMADAVKWVKVSPTCYDTPEVAVKPPVLPADTTVTVQNVSASATAVRVYAWNGSSDVMIGENTTTPFGTEVAVTTTALEVGWQIKATQVVAGIEGCLPLSGTQVGTCDQIPVVQPKPVLIPGDTSVTVAGVAAGAAAVYVYRDDGVTVAQIGANNSPPAEGGDVTVTTSALVAGWTVFATQKIGILEGCVTPQPPGIVIDDCSQVAAVRVAGMVDAGRTQIWVDDVSASATAVKVYANDTLVGTNNAPTSPRTAVTLTAALVEGQTVKATQVVRREGCLPATGRRVMAAGMIEDFEDGVVASDNLFPTAYERTWYDVSSIAYSDSYATTAMNGTTSLNVLDAGWTNGAYAVFDDIIPPEAAANSQYHLTMDMIVDERNADPDFIQDYEIGVVVNGAHRDPGGILPNISPAGKYVGALTPVQNGLTIDPIALCYSLTVTVNPGDSLLIAFSTSCSGYTRSKTADPARPGMMIDNIKLNVGPKPCLPQDVPQVAVTGASDIMPLQVGATEVKVTGIDPTASQVSVYEYTPDPDTWTLIGTATSLGGASSALVTLTQPLVAHRVIVATQTMTVCDPPQVMEGEKKKIGPVVGTGKNSPLLLSLGVREVAVPTGGCVIGTDGGTTGGIEWIGPSSTVSGAPQGKLLNPSTEWQTVTFDPASDPVLSFNAGNGVLDGACNVFEHLALASTATNTGAYTVLIDNVKSGTTVVEDFESYLAGDAAMFNTPNYSGTTSANLLLPDPSIAAVVAEGDASNQSLKVVFQYKDEEARRWLRLVTSAVANRPNPIIDITQPISMRIKFTGATCNDPFADADNDDDVDQADFAAFQACFTGSGNDLVGGCECFDRDDDGDIDSDDAGAFEACASGPGIAADPNCD